MIQQTPETSAPFRDRRRSDGDGNSRGIERRQFQDGQRSSRPDVAEFANAVDQYKINNRRRFITFDELFDVFTSLGYHR